MSDGTYLFLWFLYDEAFFPRLVILAGKPLKLIYNTSNLKKIGNLGKET